MFTYLSCLSNQQDAVSLLTLNIFFSLFLTKKKAHVQA